MTLWNKIVATMANHPERLTVVRTLLESGLAIRHSRIYLNEIEVPAVKIARVARVDRRTVGETIKSIESSPELKTLFEKLGSAGISLKGVAHDLGLGTVEILVENPSKPGIIAGASRLLSDSGISIRQALVDDPDLVPEPKLVLISDRPVPGELVTKLREIHGVVRVSLY
jgi:uncharacterized protein